METWTCLVLLPNFHDPGTPDPSVHGNERIDAHRTQRVQHARWHSEDGVARSESDTESCTCCHIARHNPHIAGIAASIPSKPTAAAICSLCASSSLHSA
eukprot:6030138-Prymnesium_polylepis.1